MKKLKHYFQSYKIQVVSKIDPIKHLYEAPSLVGKHTKWLVLLTEFDVQYLTKKTIKGKAIAEFLALNPILDSKKIQLEFNAIFHQLCRDGICTLMRQSINLYQESGLYF